MISDGTLRKGLKASNYHAAIPRENVLATREYDLLLESDRPAAMKILSALIATCLLALLVSAQAAEPTKEAEREQQQLAELAKEVQSQQATIAENQTKIDAKMATIAEALRYARIYSSRAK
jgi:uncharacterized protein YlxW (UPF0749 family)